MAELQAVELKVPAFSPRFVKPLLGELEIAGFYHQAEWGCYGLIQDFQLAHCAARTWF